MRKFFRSRSIASNHIPVRAAQHGTREVYFTGHAGPIETPAYRRDALRAGNRIKGPALIEEHASTTVLFPGDRAEVDKFGNIVIAIGAAVR